MFETPTPGSGRRFIEDVAPPPVWNNFNSGDTRVRRQSIGYLDSQYMRHMHGAGQIDVDDYDSEEPTIIPVRRKRGYTRIPPLATFDVYSKGKAFIPQVKAYIMSCAVAVRSYAGSIGYFRSAKQLRWSAPALLIASGGLLAGLAWSGPAVAPASGIAAPVIHSSAIANINSNTPQSNTASRRQKPSSDSYTATNNTTSPALSNTKAKKITSVKITSVPVPASAPATSPTAASSVVPSAKAPVTNSAPSTPTTTPITTPPAPTPTSSPVPSPTSPNLIDNVMNTTNNTVQQTVKSGTSVVSLP